MTAADHRAHLRLAWVYLTECPSTEEATARMAAAIRRFAAAAGRPEKFSGALTASWMQRLAAVRRAMPGAEFDDVVAANPLLLDSKSA